MRRLALPMSPMRSSAPTSVRGASRVAASGAMRRATTQSTGNIMRSPARSISRAARSTPSSSTRDRPVSSPSARKKVLAMAPPTSSRSARASIFSMTAILSDTLAPPRTATKGRSGSSSASPRKRISRSRSSPATASPPLARIACASPAVEACARCAVPKASFTKCVPRAAKAVASSGSLRVSPARKRVFSTTRISPGARVRARASASGPVVSGLKRTSSPRSSPSRAATGASEASGRGRPPGRPRWERRTRRAPVALRRRRVGRVRSMRVSSATLPFRRGTLKSTRTTMRSPARAARSFRVFLRIAAGPAGRAGS